jgi:hypothetical protein
MNLFKLHLNGTCAEVASVGDEGGSTSMLNGKPGTAAMAPAAAEMSVVTGMLR